MVIHGKWKGNFQKLFSYFGTNLKMHGRSNFGCFRTTDIQTGNLQPAFDKVKHSIGAHACYGHVLSHLYHNLVYLQ